MALKPLALLAGLGAALFVLSKGRQAFAEPIAPGIAPKPPTPARPPVSPVSPKTPGTSVTPVTPVKPKPKPKPKAKNGVDTYDSYGQTLLNSNAGRDELYSYAMSSLSIPFVRDVGNRFAAAGDTRALDLTSRLAWLTSNS